MLVAYEQIRFHDMRHFYVTRMAELGVPLPVTQAAVGNMRDHMSLHYTHISENAQRAAVEKVDAIRNAPRFVDVLVEIAEEEKVKVLN